MSTILNLVYLFLAAMVALPVLEVTVLAARRARALRAYGAARGVTALAVVYREERLGLLGQPLVSYVAVPTRDDLRRALSRLAPRAPIEVVVHLPRGAPVDVDRLAGALDAHDGPVTLVVPVCALTGGRRLLGCADQVLTGRHATVADDAEPAGRLAGGELPAALGALLSLYPQPPRGRLSPVVTGFDGTREPPDTGERHLD